MNHKSVLIVDDDNLMRLSLASLLRSEGVETQTASTMEEAEILLKTEHFDLAIIDLRLTESEGLEGLELISKIKAQTPGTQAVLFTAYGSPEIEQEALQRGADEYWEKSLQLPMMLERLNALGISAGRERKEGQSE
jgi:DNA-binding NtrC family response regulator